MIYKQRNVVEGCLHRLKQHVVGRPSRFAGIPGIRRSPLGPMTPWKAGSAAREFRRGGIGITVDGL
ncbi:hypothetical protein ACLQ22_22520 [Micromonospora sp. DT178]|uniref:hypothetical protein n=1 Tax=Micromonospora sp. DT178 TaxID=3393436 RepID=UPI003CEFC595